MNHILVIELNIKTAIRIDLSVAYDVFAKDQLRCLNSLKANMTHC